MWFTLFMILLVIDALILIPAILLQAGQGGGLATQFGGASSTDSFVGGRQAATILTKASWYAGGGFLVICFMLSLISTSRGQRASVVEQQLRQQTQQEAPAAPAPLPLPGAEQPAPTQGQPPR